MVALKVLRPDLSERSDGRRCTVGLLVSTLLTCEFVNVPNRHPELVADSERIRKRAVVDKTPGRVSVNTQSFAQSSDRDRSAETVSRLLFAFHAVVAFFLSLFSCHPTFRSGQSQIRTSACKR